MKTTTTFRCLIWMALLLVSRAYGQKNPELPYPKPPAYGKPEIFLPGIVSTNARDFGSAFSPDGKSFYFARSENGKSKIYVTRYIKKQWTAAVLVSSSQAPYSDADPAFAPNGNFYFISTRPTDPHDTLPDYNIWVAGIRKDGRLTDPDPLKIINSDSSEFYISFAKNGNLYFSSSRQGGFGEEDIYVSRFENGQYQLPENVGAAVNSEKSEYDPGVSKEDEMIVFTSPNRKDTRGGGDLYFSRRRMGKWIDAVHFGEPINTPAREYCSYFSPDARYFFYSSEGDVKWIDMTSFRSYADKLLK
jgi:Tol biopolymer transport system component